MIIKGSPKRNELNGFPNRKLEAKDRTNTGVYEAKGFFKTKENYFLMAGIGIFVTLLIMLIVAFTDPICYGLKYEYRPNPYDGSSSNGYIVFYRNQTYKNFDREGNLRGMGTYYIKENGLWADDSYSPMLITDRKQINELRCNDLDSLFIVLFIFIGIPVLLTGLFMKLDVDKKQKVTKQKVRAPSVHERIAALEKEIEELKKRDG